MKKKFWPDEYYGAIEHYFWEPQKLHRKKLENSTTKTVVDFRNSLHAAEVSLNHMLEFFFRLAPNELSDRFFLRKFPDWIPEPLDLCIRPSFTIGKTDICQPDLFFEGSRSQIAIEIKIKHKASLEQLCKYAVGLRYSPMSNDLRSREPLLLFITPSAGTIWKDGCSLDNYLDALNCFELPSSLQKAAKKLGIGHAEVLELARNLPVAHVTYSELRSFLEDELIVRVRSESDETLNKLIIGLIVELERRKLASPGHAFDGTADDIEWLGKVVVRDGTGTMSVPLPTERE